MTLRCPIRRIALAARLGAPDRRSFLRRVLGGNIQDGETEAGQIFVRLRLRVGVAPQTSAPTGGTERSSPRRAATPIRLYGAWRERTFES